MKKIILTSILSFLAIVGMAQGYTVIKGDTLFKIAQKNNTTVNELMAINPQIVDKNLIYLGQEINLPINEGSDFLGSGTTPIAGTTYNLAGSGVSSSATSFSFQSLTIPQTGQKILDANLSDIFYITLEPGNKTRQEIVACTTVTQNSGGTATISGCSRGMSPIYPYTASTTLAFSHGGGTQAIFSDPPQLFNEFARLLNNNLFTGLNEFGTTTDTATENTWIKVGTSTPVLFKNIGGVAYYCNNGASCATIGGGASTYNFIWPLTTSGSDVKIATSTYEWDYNSDKALSVATSTISNGVASGKGIEDWFNSRMNATTTWATNLTVGGNATITSNFIVGSLGAAPTNTVSVVGNSYTQGNATTTKTQYVGGSLGMSDEYVSKLFTNLYYASSSDQVFTDCTDADIHSFTVPAMGPNDALHIRAFIQGAAATYISSPVYLVLDNATNTLLTVDGSGNDEDAYWDVTLQGQGKTNKQILSGWSGFTNVAANSIPDTHWAAATSTIDVSDGVVVKLKCGGSVDDINFNSLNIELLRAYKTQ